MSSSKPPPIFSTMNFEREIEAEIRNRPPLREGEPNEFAPPAIRAPALSMPDYVEHSDGATEIGKLSAEAVVREYELAAKEIENMGAELLERVRQCETMVRDALARDGRDEGNRGALPRRGQAHLPGDRGLFAGDGGSAQDLQRADRKDRDGYEGEEGKTHAAPGERILVTNSSFEPGLRQMMITTAVCQCHYDAPMARRRNGAAPRERAFGNLCKETAR